ncbi:family 20 glycosylhydrolase [Streptomyces spiralis]
MDARDLFPRPKAVHPRPGRFTAPPGSVVHCPPDAVEAGRAVAAFTGLPLRPDGAPGRIVAGADRDSRGAPPPDHTDAYVVETRPDRIELAAHDARGLLYAAGALAAVGPGCGRLVDFPDLALRGVHLDLKGPMPSLDLLHDVLGRLGRWKINTLLVEYEDKFPYGAGLGVTSPHALTKGQLRGLLEDAARLGIDVVPLVQCLGHLEYTLCRPAHAHLAEDDRRQQLCPLHPGSLRLFTTMLDEVLAAHPRASLVHIGGDEPWSLGTCQRCRAYVAEHGRPRLYSQYVARAARSVVERGRRPVVWDDVLYAERDPAMVDELPPETVLMAWEYAAHRDRTGHVRWGNPPAIVASAALRRDPEALPELPPDARLVDLESLPADEQRLLRAVKYDADDLGGHPLPWARALTARGRRLIGASGLRGCDGENVCFPLWGRRIANAAVWARQARALGAAGVVSTAWAAYSTVSPPSEPLASAWPSLAAAAELYWNADATGDDIDRLLGPVAAGLRQAEAGVTRREPHYLRSAEALFMEHGEEVLALCARHATLELETETACRTAAWHADARADGRTRADPALDAARRRSEQEVGRLVNAWVRWREAFTATLSDQYAGKGAEAVAAAKATDPLRRLLALAADLTADPAAVSTADPTAEAAPDPPVGAADAHTEGDAR